MAWDQRLVDREKARVKGELDRAAKQSAVPRARLAEALSRIRGLATDETDKGRLRRYVFIVSALVQHERDGGLSERDVSQLEELAYAILKAQGIQPRASRLAALYGDLHLIRSQIFRKDGEPWKAAWEQQVALQLSGDFPSGGLGFQLFAAGNRSLRLGDAAVAESQYREAESRGLPPAFVARCRLGRLQALWLAGRTSDAEAFLASTAVPDDIALDVRKEFAWNTLVRGCQASGDFAPLLSGTRRGQEFHASTYILEASLWAATLESRALLAGLPSLSALRRDPDMRPQRLGAWFDCAVAIRDAYDYETPTPIRLRGVGAALEQRHRLLTIDQELLVLAASIRWLARAKAQALATLVYCEYRALSRRLTDGARDDALGALGDLMSRPWLASSLARSQR